MKYLVFLIIFSISVNSHATGIIEKPIKQEKEQVFSPTSSKISDKQAKEILGEANKIRQAALDGDYVYIIKTMPKQFIKRIGSDRKKLVKAADELVTLYKSKELITEKYELSRPSQIFQFSNHALVFVKTYSVVKTSRNRVFTKGYLLALQYRTDSQWYFIDGKGLAQANNFRNLFGHPSLLLKPPEYSTKVVEIKKSGKVPK